jgi:hypothetical protein
MTKSMEEESLNGLVATFMKVIIREMKEKGMER